MDIIDHSFVSLGTSASSVRNPVPSIDAKAPAAEQQQKGDFFGKFFQPPSQQSNYVPFQGAASAASAVMGGIWSVIDTALAVLNEEFESNQSNSIISDDSNEDKDEESRIEAHRAKRDSSYVTSCCEPARSKFSCRCGGTKHSSTDNEHIASTGPRRTSAFENLPRTVQNAIEISIETSPSQEFDYFTPQNSLMGSISALLLLYEGGSGEIEKLSKCSTSDVLEIERSADDVFGDIMDQSEMNEKEDSEYCFIENETETNDGWMILSDE